MDSRVWRKKRRHMPFTEQQLTSALATKKQKKKNKKQKTCVFFSSTKKTIYLYPFTDSAGGQDGVQWRTVGRHLCTVLWLCRHTQLWNRWETGLISVQQLLLFSFFFKICSSMTSVILKRCSRCPYMERFSFEPRLLTPPFIFIIKYMSLWETPVDLKGGIVVIHFFSDTFVRWARVLNMLDAQWNALSCLRDTNRTRPLSVKCSPCVVCAGQ